jgi:hypothetical protein
MVDAGAILVGPLRDPLGFRTRRLWRITFLKGATVFENSTACAPFDRPSVEECVQVRRRRSNDASG